MAAAGRSTNDTSGAPSTSPATPNHTRQHRRDWRNAPAASQSIRSLIIESHASKAQVTSEMNERELAPRLNKLTISDNGVGHQRESISNQTPQVNNNNHEMDLAPAERSTQMLANNNELPISGQLASSNYINYYGQDSYNHNYHFANYHQQHNYHHADPHLFNSHQNQNQNHPHVDSFGNQQQQQQLEYVNLDQRTTTTTTSNEEKLPESVIRVNQQSVIKQDHAASYNQLAYEESSYSQQRHLTVLSSAQARDCHKFASSSVNYEHSQQHDSLHESSSYTSLAQPSAQQVHDDDELLLSSTSALSVFHHDRRHELYDQSSDSRLHLSASAAEVHDGNRTAQSGDLKVGVAELADELFKVCEWHECGNTFVSMDEFVRHLEEAHVNQEPRERNRYFCLWSNCKRNEQEFNARYKLLIHMRVHSGEKPYACQSNNCRKSFSRLENLKIHVRSHTGEKPYRCNYEQCTKSFTNSSDRIKHHKTHKDPKPYMCTYEGCTKRYTDPSSLRKHLRAHKRHYDVTSASGVPMAHASHALSNSLGSTSTVYATESQSYDTQSYTPGEQHSSHYYDQHQRASSSNPHVVVQHSSSSSYNMGQQEVAPLPADYDPAKEFEGVFSESQSQMGASQFVDLDQPTDYLHVPASRVVRHDPAPAPAYQNQHLRPARQVHAQLSRSWCGPMSSSQQQPIEQQANYAIQPAERTVHWKPAPEVTQRQHEHWMRSMPAASSGTARHESYSGDTFTYSQDTTHWTG